MHLSLLLFPAAYYLLAGLGVNLAYHRVLSHRSLRLPRWLERGLITLGLPAGTPIQWAGNHRFHHAHTDTPDDPHSPQHQGFWCAHTGWYLGTHSVALAVLYAFGGPLRTVFDAFWRPRTNQEHDALARDIAADGYYRWLSRPWPYTFVLLALHVAVPAYIAWHFWGVAGLMTFWLTLMVLYNLGDAIDSVAHTFGERLSQAGDQSRNSALMGLLIHGEGWHANHHRVPWSARHGIRPGQFDWTWQVIRLLRAMRLAHNVQVATHADLVDHH
ncbi:stearoyl-CoA desaturase (delta-9 desaturase) [Bryocella elongata]|uniref:Stearoyl-CoA desaturase (Delta-9 desaturase) n=1 Tax=Bryocella elongata TaxID=863522 RepID=A0A1H5S0V7_9BACT|nr:fatty acid desaturase [Bryocella elongata]SEF43467.1 stearoyl-CoA desaturase (delta-9 desaturase) [Bryocella elongata]